MNDRSETPISRKMRKNRGGRRAGIAGAVVPLPFNRALALVAAPAICLAVSASAAWADGTFKITVRSGVDGKPIQNAIVTLDETQGRELRQTVATDQDGVATTKSLSDGTYKIFASAVNFQTSAPVELSLNGDTVSVEIQLRLNKKIIVTNDVALRILDPYDTTISTTRTLDFLRRYPITAGNNQSFQEALRAFPGFVYDGLNQVHPRGDQNGIAYYIDGIEIPQFAAGHISETMTPEAFEVIKAITGNMPAQYGGQGGAAIDLTSRPYSGRTSPINGPQSSLERTPASAIFHRGFAEAGLSGGQYGTWQNYLNFGNSVNAASLRRHQPKPGPGFHKTLDYSVTFSQRYSGVGVEAPQAGSQSSQNRYSSEIVTGNVGVNLTPTMRISTLFNYSSGRNGVANRTSPNGFLGLPQDEEAPVLTNQNDEGKRERQKDNESFAFVKLTKNLKNEATASIALGSSRSSLALFQQGPKSPGPSALPQNASTEYFSVVGQDYDQAQVQGDYTMPMGLTINGDRVHLFKLGFVYQDQTGKESYFFGPFSQDAAAALRQVYGNVPFDDSNVLFINRSGNYGAFYAQDTWRLPSLPMVVNYGVRLDNYKSTNNFRQSGVSKSDFGPRVNIAYTVPEKSGLLRFLGKKPTVIRVGFNHLFTQPQGLGQGLIAGTLGVQPERTEQEDLSIEHQITVKQIVKLSVYHKDIKSALFVSQLIPGTQDGAFTTLNQGDATVDGTELQYDFNPRVQQGLGGYFILSNSKAKPKGNDFDSLGNPVTGSLFQDQRTTVSAGVSYKTKNGMMGGATLVYGSGVFAATDPIYSTGGSRKASTVLNVQYGSGPQYLEKHVGWTLGIENLFNSKTLLDLRSPYAGTRYQTGMRVVLGVNGRY